MDPKKQYYQNISSTIIKNLNARQIEAYYCPDSASAVEKALSLMPEGSSIGWGGSMTLNECGMMDALYANADRYQIIDRNLAQTPEEKREIYAKICASDFFFMSTNAITIQGELVNIDGIGSRVAFLCYGPQHVIILCGMNKICSDVDAAVGRARNIAAPPNTVRLGRNTPCTITGKCENCSSLDCICNQFVVTRRSGIPNRIKVILIGEELGY